MSAVPLVLIAVTLALGAFLSSGMGVEDHAMVTPNDLTWLAKLLRHGLLQASFIPPRGQRDVRDLTRYRTKLVQERAREVNRLQGVLERANIKLASVVSDVIGVSSRAILAALVDGRTDPAAMAELARGGSVAKLLFREFGSL